MWGTIGEASADQNQSDSKLELTDCFLVMLTELKSELHEL